MADERDRKAFLAHIESHWEDRAPRLVYADWLDENGEPEEAERQRKWHDAKDWLVAFCRKWNFFECDGGETLDWEAYKRDRGSYVTIKKPPLSDKETIRLLSAEMLTGSDKTIVADGIDLHGRGELDAGDEELFWKHIVVLTGQVFD